MLLRFQYSFCFLYHIGNIRNPASKIRTSRKAFRLPTRIYTVLRIFCINGTKLAEVTEQQFPLESEIQRLIEANLHDIFELECVKSEFELHGLRIDTLGFDNESKAFVIIEYKKDRNLSVVDQGMAYLNLMLTNKADFILEYNESSHSSHNLKREEVDWSQSRMIFISR